MRRSSLYRNPPLRRLLCPQPPRHRKVGCKQLCRTRPWHDWTRRIPAVIRIRNNCLAVQRSHRWLPGICRLTSMMCKGTLYRTQVHQYCTYNVLMKIQHFGRTQGGSSHADNLQGLDRARRSVLIRRRNGPGMARLSRIQSKGNPPRTVNRPLLVLWS